MNVSGKNASEKCCEKNVEVMVDNVGTLTAEYKAPAVKT